MTNLVYYLRKIFYLLVLIGFSSANADSYEDFFKAVAMDDARTVSSLLERGFDPNAMNPQGHPALYLAVRDGSPRVTQALLAHPQLKPDARNAFGETALMMAALRGDFALAQRLYAMGAAIDQPGWTPLHYAASGPDVAIVRWLLELRSPIDVRAPNGNTPLMMAAGYGLIDVAEELLALGANPTLRNAAGLDAAEFARRAGRERLAQRLENEARRRSEQTAPGSRGVNSPS
jgi:ankyrin repeat protein